MQTKILNYRVVVEPDTQTGTGASGFTASCPTLGIADDGQTIEEALQNIRGAIQAYVDNLVELGEPVPSDKLSNSLVTFTQINVPSHFQAA